MPRFTQALRRARDAGGTARSDGPAGQLREGVQNALQSLGQGFTGHPKNHSLRESLRSGQLSPSAFHGQLVNVVYRLMFLWVAEGRTLNGVSLLHPKDDSEHGRQARARYFSHCSAARLRELALEGHGSRQDDLWQQFNLLTLALSGDHRFEAARRQLALPGLGGLLWNPESTASLNPPNPAEHRGSELANADFLEAIRHLAFTSQRTSLQPVDYASLGSAELGGVYESLLAFTPQISSDGATLTFARSSGNERKSSGSFYTPDSLVQRLLDSTLDPVVADAVRGKAAADAEAAILNLRVCDPACGAGRFLVGAAHRLAHHLALARAVTQGAIKPSAQMRRHALREVIRRCVYGVDVNPLAVELCKVSLWMESMEPGHPLTFLDSRIKCGNSLLGTTPRLLEMGIPDEAFRSLPGDDKRVVAYYRNRNRRERKLIARQSRPALDGLSQQVDVTTNPMPAMRPPVAHRSSELAHAKLLADAWCAAFVWKKHDTDVQGAVPGFPGRWDAITEQVYREIERNPRSVPPWIRDEISRLAAEHRFFHWHLEFPEVFGWHESPPVDMRVNRAVGAPAEMTR